MPKVPTKTAAIKPFADIIRKHSPDVLPPRKSPVWKGPKDDGITFSLLSRFLTCRERFRIMMVDGLKAEDRFDHRMTYGNMWHICEEATANGKWDNGQWKNDLKDYARELSQQYKFDHEAIWKWHRVCLIQYPLYLQFWAKHKHAKRIPLLAEYAFKVPYELPSRRVVTLRGKMDSVDLIDKGIWLQENKTKGNPDEVALRRQLTFDLQTMMYLTALKEDQQTTMGGLGAVQDQTTGQLVRDRSNESQKVIPIKGVRYNVIRRPLSGGKGTIVKHKPTKKNPNGESEDQYFERLSGILNENKKDYFMRFEVTVDDHDIEVFKERCLNPILENLCDWWNEVSGVNDADMYPMTGGYMTPMNWVHPFGVRNILDEGGYTDIDEYLTTGSKIGLRQVDNLFPEL